MNFCTTLQSITHISKSLGVLLLPPLFLPKDPSSNLVLVHVFLLGILQGLKGTDYMILTTNVYLSRDVIFHETTFPFHSMQSSPSLIDLFPELVLPIISSDIHLPEPTAPSSSSSITLRRSLRPHKHPTYLQDYHCHLLRSHDLSDHVSLPYPFPLSKVLSYDRLSASYKQFILNVSSHFEPKFYHQAVLYSIRQCKMNYQLWIVIRHGL